uniref:Transmembrane protein n=1 Tax=Plectus sambesii TaxID=2011161 RepID=A0A914UN57_9BILA
MLSESSVNEQARDIQFNPNDSKYRCCCEQCHATTGVKIIAGMLCVTVILELWHFIVTAVSSGNGAALVASASQLLVGVAIAWTVIYALCTEKAGYLLPYLVLQAIGLAAGMVFLVTFLCISLFGNSETVLTWLEDQGHTMDEKAKHDFEAQLGRVSWLLVLSFVLVVLLQVWLISIVVACWRYFRGKRAHGFIVSYGTISYVIVGGNNQNSTTAAALAHCQRTQPSMDSSGTGQQVSHQLHYLPDGDIFHSKIDRSPSCSLAMSFEDRYESD